MSRNPESPGSSDEGAPLQSQSIAGSTNTAEVTAEKTPVTTEEAVEADEAQKDDSK